MHATALQRRYARYAVGALARLAAGAAIVASPLSAQDTTRATRDTAVVRDSAALDTTRVHSGPVDDYALLPALGAVLVVFAVAPSSLLLSPKLTNPAEGVLPFARSHVAAYGTLGVNYDDRGGWLYSEHVEVLRGRLYGELGVEQFHIPRFYRTETLRLGYLVHPKSVLAGGVTVGYRHADADSLQKGVEVGFPLFFGDEDVTARFEPTYVVSGRDGVCWNYRMQGEFPIRKSAYFAGFGFEARSLGRGDLGALPITLVFGARF